MDNLEEFHSFLEASGAELLNPTNKYEVCRFRVAGKVSVIYQNKKGKFSFVGLADEAYSKFIHGVDWKPTKQKRKPIKSKKRDLIKSRDGDRCFYCQNRFVAIDHPSVTIEHLLNVSHGGSNHIHNLVLCCKRCNVIAGDKSIIEKIKIRESYIATGGAA